MRMVSIMAAAAITLVGCSEGTSVDGTGSVRIISAPVVGATGSNFIAFIEETPWRGMHLGSYCETIPGDSAVIVGTVAESGADPCDLGAAARIPLGTYNVYGGVYAPGSTLPTECTEITVEVTGAETTVLLPQVSSGICPF